jgi:hypothetical protein
MEIDLNTQKKLKAVLNQISQLLLSDFPHASSEDALKLMQRYFVRQRKRLDEIKNSSTKKTIINTCITINERIYQHLPILGFLLRSTNARNAFEAYYSLLQIARALIGPKAKVIVSSEWDYSPLTYPMTVSVLPNYVLLGLPSTESLNSLILPLAGHEFGHSVWLNDNLENKYDPDVNKSAKVYLKNNWQLFAATVGLQSRRQPTENQLGTNRLLIDARSDIVTLALIQMEETFCDALGVHLFGHSYAYAFHYLLAPSLGGVRPTEYPNLATRAKWISAALNLGRTGFRNYASQFQEKEPTLVGWDAFLVRAADAIAMEFSTEMYSLARDIVHKRARRFIAEAAATDAILHMFNHEVPAQNPRSLSDILNAAWMYANQHASSHKESKRALFEWTAELVLKSVEVLEYRSRVRHARL